MLGARRIFPYKSLGVSYIPMISQLLVPSPGFGSSGGGSATMWMILPGGKSWRDEQPAETGSFCLSFSGPFWFGASSSPSPVGGGDC